MNIVTAHLVVEEPIKGNNNLIEVNVEPSAPLLEDNHKKFVTGKIINGVFIEEEYPSDIIYKVDINGDQYEGKLKNDKRHGFGKCTYASGSYYVGNFINDEATGKGILKTIYGNTYTGYFKNQLMNGYCRINNSDGTLCTGNWRNGYRDGEIKFYDVEGYCTKIITYKKGVIVKPYPSCSIM